LSNTGKSNNSQLSPIKVFTIEDPPIAIDLYSKRIDSTFLSNNNDNDDGYSESEDNGQGVGDNVGRKPSFSLLLKEDRYSEEEETDESDEEEDEEEKSVIGKGKDANTVKSLSKSLPKSHSKSHSKSASKSTSRLEDEKEEDLE